MILWGLMAKKRKKLWYNIKQKGKKRWHAFELFEYQLKNLKPDYEYKGPFRSLIVAWIASNEETKKTN